MSRAIDVEKAIEIIETKQKELCPVGRYGRNYVYGSDREKYDAWDEIIDVLENLPTLTPPNEWVSVEERLPEYNPSEGAKSYWIAKKDCYGNWQMKLAQFCDYGYAMTVDAETEVTWRDWDFTKIVGVTHWMLLPAPPTKEE